MIKLIDHGVYYCAGEFLTLEQLKAARPEYSDFENAYKGTISYGILNAHNCGPTDRKMPLKLKFDALASHDITYVGIIQTAKASGLEKFPVPYVLTNCHNSLCAVGGTINEDDHLFGLSAAKKYGGIYVPAHLAVIHTYMRENMAACGKMILGSDSHTRYGALGTMAVGEGGPELVKQLLNRTYDIGYPEIVAVRLTGKVRKGVGPQDVALALIGATFKNGFVKNKVLEFVGDGIGELPVEFRNGIDVMTTETTCLSSVWTTDYRVHDYFVTHGRVKDFKELEPAKVAYYDSAIEINLSEIEPMIALPFHPSNVYKLSDLLANPMDILSKVEQEGNKQLNNPAVNFRLTDKVVNGKIMVGQGVIAGCAGGTYDNIVNAAAILKDKSVGHGNFTLNVYPSSQPVYLDLIQKGVAAELIKSGAIMKTAFCGPCFGAGDVPANNALSIRHTTRNFESREGSKPAGGQIASVALMDSRSIAATAANGGVLTSAMDINYDDTVKDFVFDGSIYKKRVYFGYNAADPREELVYGPNIADWPVMPELADNAMFKLAAVIEDAVTTTDELIPSGETSSYRSNPLKLAEFALSRKCPDYVAKAKAVKIDADKFAEGDIPEEYRKALAAFGPVEGTLSLASAIYAVKPGDGSAREQAASCQRVLGGQANFAVEYATKRYRSNLINWGMLPFVTEEKFKVGDIIMVTGVKAALEAGETRFGGMILSQGKVRKAEFSIGNITSDERDILLAGCLINYYKKSFQAR